MITTMGLVTVAAVAGLWFFRREWVQFAIGATVAFPQTAGLLIAGNGFPLFYLAVVVVLVLSAPVVLYRLARPETVSGYPTRRLALADLLAILLVAWAAVISIAGPRIFTGMKVFDPGLGVDEQVGNMSSLAPSLGNVAQVGYLALGVTFLLLSGRIVRVDSRLIGSTLWVSVVLAAVRLVAESAWPHELLQNMPGFNYATAERLSGTFYEPSVLGLYLTAAAGYFTARLFHSHGAGRFAALVGLGLVAVDFLANGSGTALLGLGLLGMLALLVALVRQLRSARLGVHPWLVPLVVIALGAALSQLPLLIEMTVGSASEKADSTSFASRSAANVRAFQIFVETYGLGVGLGGNRPSSLFFLVLGCLGVVGVILLGVVVVLALRSSLRRSAAAPAAWALLGVLVAAVVAVPDLSMPVIWIGLAACFAGETDWRRLRVPESGEFVAGAAGQGPALQRGQSF